LSYLPYLDRLFERLRPYIIYLSLISTYFIRPLPFNLSNAPTVGQALYIALLIILNVILNAINFKTIPAHLYYLIYHTGVLSFAIAPLLILFAGRNNFL
ncbi:hypothetical protein F5X68DRAFT_145639, partial [Plectosphaerella plurivora]